MDHLPLNLVPALVRRHVPLREGLARETFIYHIYLTSFRMADQKEQQQQQQAGDFSRQQASYYDDEDDFAEEEDLIPGFNDGGAGVEGGSTEGDLDDAQAGKCVSKLFSAQQQASG